MYIIEQSILVQKIIADDCIVNVNIRYALNWFIWNIAFFIGNLDFQTFVIIQFTWEIFSLATT